MNKIDASSFRLTDEIERQLLLQAIEEQYRFKPLEAITRLLSGLFSSRRERSAPTLVTTLKPSH